MNAEDLEFRKDKIGGSDAPVIMGLTPKSWKQSLYKKYREKVYGEMPKSSYVMQRGSAMEETARLEFERITGIPIMKKDNILHKDIPWMMASLDGVSFDGKLVVELKNGSKELHEMVKSKKVPEHYYCQCQHYFEVQNPDTIMFMNLHQGEAAITEIKRDQAFIDKMLDEEFKFKKRLDNLDPPPYGEFDFEEEEGRKFQELAERLLFIDSLKDEREHIREEMIKIASGRNIRGYGIEVARRSRKGAVDYKAIPELMGVNLDLYSKPRVEYWEVSACK